MYCPSGDRNASRKEPGTGLVAAILRTVFIANDLRRRVPVSRGIELSLSAAMRGRMHLGGALLFWLMALAGAGTGGVVGGLIHFLSQFSRSIQANWRFRKRLHL